MPIYRFACQECGKKFEELSSYERRDAVRCPDCNGATQVAVSTFAVKGGTGVGASTGSAPRFS